MKETVRKQCRVHFCWGRFRLNNYSEIGAGQKHLLDIDQGIWSINYHFEINEVSEV
ncbi:unnamed protein product [Lepidochelys olivacea]